MPDHEVYPLTAEQLDAWRKSAEPVVTGWAEAVRKAGLDPEPILADLRKTAAQYNSAY